VEKFRLFEPGQAWSRAEQINPFGRRRKPEIPMSANSKRRQCRSAFRHPSRRRRCAGR